MESLFFDFLIGEASQLATEGPTRAASAEAAHEARTVLRDRLVVMEAEADRTVAETNVDAMAEEAALGLPEPPPADDPLVDGLAAGGLLILPEPRRDALASVMEPNGPALLVDEDGRSLFRRLPSAVADNLMGTASRRHLAVDG